MNRQHKTPGRKSGGFLFCCYLLGKLTIWAASDGNSERFINYRCIKYNSGYCLISAAIRLAGIKTPIISVNVVIIGGFCGFGTGAIILESSV